MTPSTDISHDGTILEVPDVLPVPDSPVTTQRSMRIDLTGQEFPCGAVIEYAYAKRKRAYWWVHCCLCGTRFAACGRDLRKGNPVKCPCQQFDPNYLVGKPFGRGVVRARAGAVEYNGEAIWALECECGRVYQAKTSDLTGEKVVSCGCWRKERMAEMNISRALERHNLSLSEETEQSLT
jgi:hypothetical protein